MTNYIIRFIENPEKNGSQIADSDERSVKNIDDQLEVKRAIAKSFTLASNILSSKVKEVSFSVANYHNETIWSGKGIIIKDELEIISLTKK